MLVTYPNFVVDQLVGEASPLGESLFLLAARVGKPDGRKMLSFLTAMVGDADRSKSLSHSVD
jgi:hypothetical protein